MSKKIHVAVLMGGPSLEHDVSMNSGRGVAASLDPDRFDVTPVAIGRDGRWSFADEAAIPAAGAAGRFGALGIDCVFLALHGTFGEDGRIQGFFDVLDIPYTGSGCAASAMAMDKVRCKAVVEAQGIRVAGHIAVDRPTWAVDRATVHTAVVNEMGFPCVVKPSCQGSSFGVTIVKDATSLANAIDAAFDADEWVMVEDFVAGREITCAVLDTDPGGRLQTLPLTEIQPVAGEFYDYEAKYADGGSTHINPAPLDPELADEISEMAAHVHEIVGCVGWSRSDFMVGPDGPVWIEINTIPGLTPTSLFPEAAQAAGISYGDLMGQLIDAALRRSREQ